MRLCRFCLEDEVPLTGFYADDFVVPIDQAVEAFTEAKELELLVADTEDLLNLLPPRGPSFLATRELARWLGGLDAEVLSELSILVERGPAPAADRAAGQRLPAGPELPGAQRRGRRRRRRARRDVPLRLHEALDHPRRPRRPDRPAPRLARRDGLGSASSASSSAPTCKNVAEADALKYVAGYTVINDVSDRGFRPNPTRKKRERDAFFDWLHGKWHDGSCPIGPCIRSADSLPDPQDLPIRLWVDDEPMQDATTAQMIFPVAAIVSFLSSFVTLRPGDLISTGTPAGTGKGRSRFLKPGEVVTAEIEGIGRLVNPVEAEE